MNIKCIIVANRFIEPHWKIKEYVWTMIQLNIIFIASIFISHVSLILTAVLFWTLLTDWKWISRTNKLQVDYSRKHSKMADCGIEFSYEKQSASINLTSFNITLAVFISTENRVVCPFNCYYQLIRLTSKLLTKKWKLHFSYRILK